MMSLHFRKNSSVRLHSETINQCPKDFEFFDTRIEKGVVDAVRTVRRSRFQRTYARRKPSWRTLVGTLNFCRPRGASPSGARAFLAEEYFKGPVFITDYPADQKAFYMRLNDDGKTVAATDLVVPRLGEIIGGSQREERLNVLQEQMNLRGLPEAPYWWYTDLRRFRNHTSWWVRTWL